MNKIETTYLDMFNRIKKNPEQQFYIETHKGEYTPILAAINKTTPMLWIKFDTGYELECAEEHVFMDKEANPVFAKDLVHNSRILTKNGTISVTSIKKSSNDQAYDISIPAPHWYVNDEAGIIHHNTAYGLLMASAYLNEHPDAVMIYYDSEMGAPERYFKSFDIDTTRVIRIPIVNIEELTFDLAKKLDRDNPEAIKRGEKVFIFIDSIGNLASKKEAENALNENSAADMTRARMLKSLFRIVTPLVNSLDIPMVAVNHIYQTIGCLDGNTIIKTSNGNVKLKDIKVGDLVYSLSGLKTVSHTFGPDDLPKEGKKFMKLTLADGSEVKCTGNHEFLLEDGTWIAADQLNLNSVLK